MIRPLRSIVEDQRGATFVEMGLALPIMCFMLLGMVDVSMAYSEKLALEQAAYRALEKIQQVGYNHSPNTTPNDLTRLEDDAEAAAGAGSTATGQAYLECRSGASTLTVELFNATCPQGSSAARYVGVSITKTHTPSFGGISGSVALTGEASIRVQ